MVLKCSLLITLQNINYRSVYHGEFVAGCAMCDRVNVKSTLFLAVITGKNGKIPIKIQLTIDTQQ